MVLFSVCSWLKLRFSAVSRPERKDGFCADKKYRGGVLIGTSPYPPICKTALSRSSLYFVKSAPLKNLTDVRSRKSVYFPERLRYGKSAFHSIRSRKLHFLIRISACLFSCAAVSGRARTGKDGRGCISTNIFSGLTPTSKKTSAVFKARLNASRAAFEAVPL